MLFKVLLERAEFFTVLIDEKKFSFVKYFTSLTTEFFFFFSISKEKKIYF